MSGPRPRKSCLDTLSFLNQRNVTGNVSLKEALMRDRFSNAQTLYRRDLKGHFGCVNAIEFSNYGGEFIVSGGDDRRVLLWNVEEGITGCAKPKSMTGEHHSNIFCLSFDNSNSKLFSGGNDEQVIVHDIATGATLDVFLHQDAVYGLSVDPLNDNVFASACDDGRILIYDIRAPASEDPFCLANYVAQMHAVVYNPVEPRLLATANSKEGVGLWDVRKPRSCLMKYGGSLSAQSCMSVRINNRGDQVLALRRRLPPVLYTIDSPLPVFQFDHAGYYNSCTMKSCCFAGEDDQYVISGSDDFNLYIWKVPEEPLEVPWVGEAHLVLRGHRSIVNQVRFNPSNHLIISSGVEKIIKMWSPFTLPGSSIAPFSANDDKQGKDPFTTVAEAAATEASLEERPVYTQEEYFNLLLRSGQVISHDYSHQSTDEDPRMMAFFDALVQRELQGFSSDDDSLGSSSHIIGRFVQASDNSDSDPGVGENTHSEDEEQDVGLRSVPVLSPVPEGLQRNSDTDAALASPEHHVLNLDSASSIPAQSEIQGLSSSAAESLGGGSSSRNPLPGHRSLNTRPSISDLITLKRKEYLSNAKKVDKLIRKKHARQAGDSSTDSSSSSTSSSSSSSSTETSSENASSKHKLSQRQRRRRGLKRRRRVVSSDDDSSPERESGKDVAAVAAIRNKMAASKKANFAKLKKIRAGDTLSNISSDSGDECVSTNTQTNKNGQNENVDAAKNGSKISEKNGAVEVKDTCLFGRCEPSVLEAQEIHTLQGTTGSGEDHAHKKSSTTSITISSANGKCILENGASSSSGLPSLAKNNNTKGQFDYDNGASVSRMEEGRAKKHSENGDVDLEESKPANGTSNDTEFKFKRLQNRNRTKRKYRRRSQDQSSSDEATMLS